MTFWNDTYKGPRFRYGLQYRPLGYGAVPPDWIIKSDKKDPKFPNFGMIDYPRRLTQHEIEAYQLVEVPIKE